MLFKILSSLLGSSPPKTDNNSPLLINLQFEDGNNVSFTTDDELIIKEYVRLKLMWHANFDQPELIPYADKPFKCTLERM